MIKKTIAASALLLVILIAATVWYYRAIQDDFYAGSDLAVDKALAETALVEVESVEYYAGEGEYRIIYGKDEMGEPLIVWVGADEIHEHKAADGIDRAAVRKLVSEKHGPVTFVRLVPGIFHDELVWEAFFKKKEEAGIRHYYEYYRFLDGQSLETLMLRVQ